MGVDPYLGEVEGFDPKAPCTLCGKPVWELSLGGPTICPWCDTGKPELRPDDVAACKEEAVKTNCESCVREIDEDEVQKCEICGMDGLGNCCIGDLDHACEEKP